MAFSGILGVLRRVNRQLVVRCSGSCVWGLLLLLLTVFLWSVTALLLQLLFLANFPRPLFSTLVQSSCPAIFLLLPAAAALRSSSAWRLCGDKHGLRAPIWQVAFAGFLGTLSAAAPAPASDVAAVNAADLLFLPPIRLS